MNDLDAKAVDDWYALALAQLCDYWLDAVTVAADSQSTEQAKRDGELAQGRFLSEARLLKSVRLAAIKQLKQLETA